MEQHELQNILQEHQRWLQNPKKGNRADLTEANLTGLNLAGTKFRDVDLTNTNLTGANLRGADLREADLRDSDLTGADLTEAKLTQANLLGADLTGAKLRGADLTNANLTGANLTGADLRGADLTNAKLRGANLRGADLTNATYHLAQLKSAKNVSKRYLSPKEQTSSEDSLYQQRLEEAQQEVKASQRQKKELEQQLEQAQQDGSHHVKKLQDEIQALDEQLTQQRLQEETQQSKQAILEELQDSIKPITEAVAKDQQAITSYKKQSAWLLGGGIVCFALAIGYMGVKVFSLESGDSLQWNTTSLIQLATPSFILSLLGTALLRHDWKIRQLTIKLIEQNNQVDIAMGMLNTSLRLGNIQDMPPLLESTFEEVRKAMLFKQSSHSALSDDAPSDNTALINALTKIIKSEK